jgi:hypothetical protein
VGEGEYKTAPVLVRHYEQSYAWEQAEAMYGKEIEALPGGKIPAMIELAGFYARRGGYQEALEILQNAAQEREGILDIGADG